MNERILVMEDEAAIRQILHELLTDAGYRVDTAEDGLDGIAQFHKQQPDLVLLDIMMPKVDGYTACEMIRRESSVPIIMLTALDDEQAQIKAFELKADDYITKPFSLKLVLMRVEAVLRRTQEGKDSSSNIYRFGDVCLDAKAHTVMIRDLPVSLTATEFSLMELFLAHPNQVFTRDSLLNLVWGYDFCGDEKVINIHIMNLRHKLYMNVVETVRGVGYRLGKEYAE